MNNLELQYRLLARAYPKTYRETYEEDLVGTLLDASAPNQRRPFLREAIPLVLSGIGLRFAQSTEWKTGLRIAGVVSLFFAMTMCAGVLTLARSELHADESQLWTVSWVVVTATALFVSNSRWAYRALIPGAVTIAISVGGASLMGIRRGLLVPLAILLLLSSFAGTARRRVAMTAAVSGIALGIHTSLEWLRFAPVWTDALHELARYWYFRAEIFGPSTPAILFALLAASLVLGLWRARIAVASAALMVPFLALWSSGPGIYQFAGLDLIVASSILGFVATFAAILAGSWHHNRNCLDLADVEA